jgi:hypothetical protein
MESAGPDGQSNTGAPKSPPSQFSESLRLIQGRAVAVLGEREWKAANEFDALIARRPVDARPVSLNIALPLGRAVIR